MNPETRYSHEDLVGAEKVAYQAGVAAERQRVLGLLVGEAPVEYTHRGFNLTGDSLTEAAENVRILARNHLRAQLRQQIEKGE